MAIIVTPGSPSANSYDTIAEADAYHQGNPYAASGWMIISPLRKEQLLRRATRLIDVMPGAWEGRATYAKQALGFPRRNLKTRNGYPVPSTVLPQELKDATAEYAWWIEQADLSATNDVQAQGVKSVSAGPVSVSFRDPLTAQQQFLPSQRANAGMVPDVVKAMIPTSWLIPVKDQIAAEKQGPVVLVF
jgi:hypothetical protein